MSINVTNKERAVLESIADSEYHSGPRDDEQEIVDHAVYTFSVDPPEGCDRKSLPGIIASLVKKGLAWVDEYEGDETVAINKKGFDIVNGKEEEPEAPASCDLCGKELGPDNVNTFGDKRICNECDAKAAVAAAVEHVGAPPVDAAVAFVEDLGGTPVSEDAKADDRRFCQRHKVSPHKCGRIAKVTRTTNKGIEVRLCSKCDETRIGDKTIGEIVEMKPEVAEARRSLLSPEFKITGTDADGKRIKAVTTTSGPEVEEIAKTKFYRGTVWTKNLVSGKFIKGYDFDRDWDAEGEAPENKLFVLTDGETVFLKKRMTSLAADEKNPLANKATDGLVWWAPASKADEDPQATPPYSTSGASEENATPEPSESADPGEGNLEAPAHDLPRARKIFDELSVESYYGFNLRMVLAELPADTLGLLEQVAAKARKARGAKD